MAVSRIKVNELLLVAVTLSYSLTWVPAQILGGSGEKLSLIRLIGVPLIIVSFILEPDSYAKVLQNRIILAFVLSALLGMGLGIILGSLSFSTIVSFVPSVLAILFYARRTDYFMIRKVIRCLVLGSVSICVLTILAHIGLISPVEHVEIEIANLGLIYKRTWAGLASSHIGPWMILLLSYSVIGGLYKSKYLILSATGLFISFLTSFYNGQRSTVFALILALASCIGLFYYHLKHKTDHITMKIYLKRTSLNATSIIIIFLMLFVVVRPDISTIKYRIDSMFRNKSHYGSEERLMMWKYFLIDLIKNPSIVGKEDTQMAEKLGAGTHIFLGESFYYGGVLLFVCLVVILFSSLYYLLKKLSDSSSYLESKIMLILSSTLIACLVYLMVMPGLFSRLPYILLGITQGLKKRDYEIQTHKKWANG